MTVLREWLTRWKCSAAQTRADFTNAWIHSARSMCDWKSGIDASTLVEKTSVKRNLCSLVPVSERDA